MNFPNLVAIYVTDWHRKLNENLARATDNT